MIGEDALIIHEVFDDTKELKVHLTKGTAERYKKDIDQIAEPERTRIPAGTARCNIPQETLRSL